MCVRNIQMPELHLGQKHLFLLIPLILSAYTHLWNPVGFPDFFLDEGVYLRRALHVLEGLGPQERDKYDHPYFGQLFLAFTYKIIGYPDSLNPKPGDAHSIEMLYLIPRVLIGLLAVLDTFLIYMIGDKLYGSKVGFVASLFFAIMPGTWVLRRILLDSLLLPFLLSSILFAVSIGKKKDKSEPIKAEKGINLKNNLLTTLSGVFLGLAIFTKIPVFTMIPLIAYLLLRNSNYTGKRALLKILGLWFMPVILISAVWPIFALAIGQFDLWKDGVFEQATRSNGGLVRVIDYFSRLDPVILIMGFLGLAYAAIRKELFTVIWIVPFLLFLYFINYGTYFYIIPVLPAFCISAAWLVVDAPVWMSHKLGSPSLSKSTLASISIVVIIVGIGITSNSMLLVLDASRAQIQAEVYADRYIMHNLTVISSPIYSWVPLYVFNHSQTLESFWDVPDGKVQYDFVLLLADSHLRSAMKQKDLVNLWSLYNSTTLSTQFTSETKDYDTKKYPYTNLQAMREGASVDIRNGSYISIG